MKDDRLYLQHIHEALSKIHAYTTQGHDAFINNPMAQDAVIKNFEIIREASKRLSDSAKASEPTIPWRSVSGFSDVLIHDYMGVDLDEVWNVVKDHVSSLLEAVTRMLATMNS